MNNTFISKLIWKIGRIIRNKIKRKKLYNLTPTIISSDCNGAIILNDIGLKFNTPTVNLFMNAKDFVKFTSNLHEYLGEEHKLIEIESECDYPVGLLLDIKIYFMHYNSFDEAFSKWEERKKRVNWNNIFLMMTDRNNCEYEDLVEFDSLPYNKVIFTKQKYSNIKSSFYISGFEEYESVGVLSDKKGLLGARYLDDFDYVGFLNNYNDK